MKFIVRPIKASETRQLRQQILRPSWKVQECVYKGDDSADTLHAGAFLKRKLVGIASVFRQTRPVLQDLKRNKMVRIDSMLHNPVQGKDNNSNAWQLRGMATVPEIRKQGCGSTLLRECIKHVKSNGGVELWCYARLNSVKLYEDLSFICISEVFEIPGIGQHFLMVKQIY